ncbi:cobalamin biosynthesis protein [Pseudaminobacter sp. 19-2017]|uniref:Cobalamin biosynthesis protein n=1 Tax=Pseudaminobacter soli (ex Zhang et al. 2022) TaxID=2831468 RepID=A0A942DXG4_9HYPH|nr:cobalamin biosynthesis protein [Pseudaminobacter soli]MBS3649261.1 cobalamin biosynthesis protein [Pseudaminobacter soli]
MIVAGIGCRKDASEAEVLAAIRGAAVQCQISAEQIDMLAVPEVKSQEPGVHAAARALALHVMIVGGDDLKRAGVRTLSRSEKSIEVTGAPSASEAAALAAIGERGRLLGPRIAVGPVTCALACDGVLS